MKSVISEQRKLATIFLVAAMAVTTFGSTASAAPQGYIPAVEGVGLFYGTFNQQPSNIALLVGGDVEDFCVAGHDGNPGSAPSRVFLRSDGTVDVKVNDTGQPIFLYSIEFGGVPPWLDQVCPSGAPYPEPFAEGSANLKVRVSALAENHVEIFNSVNGKATGTDGTKYKVRASADFAIINGELDSAPEDFVRFRLKKVGR